MKELAFFFFSQNEEIDLIEEDNNHLVAFEMKAGKKNPKLPKAFSEAYPEAEFLWLIRKTFGSM